MKQIALSFVLSIIIQNQICSAVNLDRDHSDFMQGIVDDIHELNKQPVKHDAFSLSLGLPQ